MIHLNSRLCYGRRDFLRLAAGSSLALTAGGLLAGCGGGSSLQSAGSQSPTKKAKYRIDYLFSTAASSSRSRARTRQETVQAAPAGVRLGKINQKGEVAAEDYNVNFASAALYRNGAIIDAGVPVESVADSSVPGGFRKSDSWVRDLNDNSQMLIEQYTVNPGERLIQLWLSENGTAQELPLPYGSYEFVLGGAIANNGAVYGTVTKPQFAGGTGAYIGQFVSAFVYQGGAFTLFGPQGGSPISVNDAGQIAGYTWDHSNGPVTLILWQGQNTNVPLGISSALGPPITLKINTGGAVLACLPVAVSGTNITYQTYLWLPNSPNSSTGSLAPLAGLPAAPAYFAGADMNDLRDIVGALADGSGGDPANPAHSRAAIINSGDTIQTPIDLNTLIPADSGWTLASATSINNAGIITGEGLFNGEWGCYMLTPSPA